jgi:16S rRNA processing protein RimM
MKYLNVGKIIGTHGIKGEVKVLSDSAFKDERFRKGQMLYVKREGNMEPITIDSHRSHKNLELITFNHYQNINDVLSYLGAEVYVDRNDLPELDGDEYYYDDLIGMSVRNSQGETLGIVEDIAEVPQGEILIIRKTDGSEAWVPFVSEFIKDVDCKQKIIIIEPIEGLL